MVPDATAWVEEAGGSVAPDGLGALDLERRQEVIV